MARRALFVSTVLCVTLFLAVPASDVQVRTLTFEERVQAQEVIERVYHAHQIGVTRSFEQAVTRDALELEVRTYLEQSAALDRLWGERVTSQALQREWERIVRHTRYPDRLREIAEGLNWDPLLLFECLVRPTLTNRLVGDLYARDDRLHIETRREADKVRALLLEGDFEAASTLAEKHLVHLKRVVDDSRVGELALRPSPLAAAAGSEWIELDAGTYRARRSRAPRGVGQVGSVSESRSAFEIRVVLEESADHVRIASFTVPKQGRDVWWREARTAFRGATVTPFVDWTAEELRSTTESLLGFAGAFDPSCVPDDTWDNGILEDPNPARDGHSAVWTGTEMIIWGGGELNSGLRYDPLLDVFAPTSRENAPSPRSFHTAVWAGGEMLVWGGWPLNSTGGRYDPAQDSWTSINSDGAPTARFDHTAVWTGYAMLIWGGNEGGARLSNGAKYFPEADAWIPITTRSAPQPRDRHTAIWTGTEMVVWGGLGPDPLADGSRYNPIQDRWNVTTTKEVPRERADHIAVWTGSKMIVWGGANAEGPNSTGGRYDPVADHWSPTSTSGAPSVGDGEVGVWTGDELVVWRGTDPGAQGRYDPNGNSWSSMSAGPNAPPASLATAVWTGDEVIVWSPASGGRYDPLGDSWSATQQLVATGGPSDRTGHTAVWTGNEMIVWGGPTGADPVGSRYDPLLETWTPVSAVGAPERRTDHTAVWSGDEMIVWGGNTSGVLLDTGGRYDPALDSWQSIASLDAPQARDAHSAVWTGDKMIVWGGFAGGDTSTEPGCLAAWPATGAAYDPVANSWAALATDVSVLGREGQGLVWSGSEMLVWGGQRGLWNPGAETCPLVSFTGGSRYDLDQDSWMLMTVDDEPSARIDHTAVWSGDAMVVWGGASDSTMLDSGGRYFPATDSWLSTSLDGAPAARGGHTAIWTGSEMVVWGGGAYLNSGSRYQPEWDIWRATSPAGAPAARNGHTAVWTEDLMIVWGGSEPMGGRYALGHPDNNGDGIADGCRACPDGPASDTDGDGILCASDNCPFDANAGQEDEDGDLWGDVCDPCLDDPVNDADYDLICHSVDNCTSAYNPDQADANENGAGDVCDPNDDFDSLLDVEDNCRVDSNEDQTDSDGDGAGDACDPCIWDVDDDLDADGACGDVDNCPTVFNPTQSDLDRDSAGDACDICPSDSNDAVLGNGLCFAPEVRHLVDRMPYSVTTGDFDGDGLIDASTANFGFSRVSTLTNLGDGLLDTASTMPTEFRPVFLRAADFNSDGISDLAVINTKWNQMNPAPGSVTVFLGTTSGFEPYTVSDVGYNPQALTIADFDLDGNPDVVVTNRETGDMSFLRGSAFGNLYAEIIVPIRFNRRPEYISSGDFNNDQYPDLAVSITNTDLLQIYLGVGNGTFNFFAEGPLGPGGVIHSLTVGDFNEDGTLDLAVSQASASYDKVTILAGNGTGEFLFAGDVPAGNQGLSIHAADLNRDGHDDLMMTNFDEWDISILTGDGALGFDPEVRLPVGARPSSITTGDLTGDGRASIAVANRLSDDVSLYLNQGPFGPSPPVADAGPSGIWIVPADSPSGATVPLDGSGSTDPDSTPGTADDIVLYEWYKDFGLVDQAFLGVGKSVDILLGIGGHRVTLRTTDKAGLSDTNLVTVTVMDPNLIPDLTLEFTPSTLWPPNHRMVEMQLTIVPGPTCSHPSAVLGSITSTEPDNASGLADGNTDPDIKDAYIGIPDHMFRLRAERSALNPGRKYYVTYMVSCSAGNVKPLLTTFTVPFEKDGTAEPMRILLNENANGTLVSWNPVEGAQHYDVIRGSLDNLQEEANSFDLGSVACIEENSVDESTAGFEDAVEPVADEVFFYLVRYIDEAESGYGTESVPKPRVPAGGDCL